MRMRDKDERSRILAVMAGHGSLRYKFHGFIAYVQIIHMCKLNTVLGGTMLIIKYIYADDTYVHA